MPRLEVPLTYRRLRSTGDVVVHAEYVFPCYLLGDLKSGPARPRSLLGLTWVINQIRLIFDGTPTPVAQRGVLVVEKK